MITAVASEGGWCSKGGFLFRLPVLCHKGDQGRGRSKGRQTGWNVAHPAPVAAGELRNLVLSALFPSGPQTVQASLVRPRHDPPMPAVCGCPLKEDNVTASHILSSRSFYRLRKRACFVAFARLMFHLRNRNGGTFQMAIVATGEASRAEGYRCVRNSTKESC